MITRRNPNKESLGPYFKLLIAIEKSQSNRAEKNKLAAMVSSSDWPESDATRRLKASNDSMVLIFSYLPVDEAMKAQQISKVFYEKTIPRALAVLPAGN